MQKWGLRRTMCPSFTCQRVQLEGQTQASLRPDLGEAVRLFKVLFACQTKQAFVQ